MKTLTTLLFTAFSLAMYAQNVPIPDANFKNALTSSLCVDTNNNGTGDVDADTNNDGEIQVSEALAVSRLIVSDMNISSLSGIEYFTNLLLLDSQYNPITTLNVQGLTNLQKLFCNNNYLDTLVVQGLTNLQVLSCGLTNLSSLNLQGLVNLQDLRCNHSLLTNLNLQGLTSLQYLDCSYSHLTSLDVQVVPNLNYLDCRWNYLTSLNLQGMTTLQYLYCYNTYLTSLNVQGCINLQILWCGFFPDGYYFGPPSTLSSSLNSLNLQGLTNLQSLNCSYCPITSLNVQGLTNLQSLNCSYCPITSLNVQGLTGLGDLTSNHNLLTSLNVQGCIGLFWLGCDNNQLASLNVQGLTNLQYLYCNNNQLTSLNVQGLTNLQHLACGDNQLTSLNVQGLTHLQNLYCNNNLIGTLDVQNLNQLTALDCHSNHLTSLYIKNGRIETPLDFSSNPNLTYICCDDGQATQVQNLATQSGLNNCAVNSYCSFTPGGLFYTIQGDVTFDSNNNGCDPLDILYPNLTFHITNGTAIGTFISNTSGHYSIPVIAGTHTLTPVLQNPAYFNITPSTTQVSFPSSPSPLTRNYCITPNGIHHDVEVTIVPTTSARPGFNASYRIIYKNKGNQVENGNLTFTYDDSRLDLVSSNLNPDYQATDSLQWNYSNLMPFETRVINLVLNVNSPMETPPVHVGNILDFSVAITGGQPEETPGDNNTELHQTVVGSYDPNDKTCLEGNVITPDMVGDDVHYLIRFENTGTYAAENVVVKDTIDISKFEISTLQIVNTSHPMWTRITEGNIVEFIFENIQLPFASGSNDGFVAFKIKTKSTLSLGDQLSNQASIYFDYNLPIVTNNAVTTVAVHQATASIAQSNHVCNSASLSASWLGVGSTYLWSTGETTATISGTASTVYTVTVTDVEGNTASASSEIVQQSITTSTTGSPTTCGLNNGTVTTSAIGTYLWNTGETTPSLSNVPAGTYQVTVTGANGCIVVSSAIVDDIPMITTSNVATPTTCGLNNGTATTSASGSYLWSNGETTQTIVNLTAGNYEVTVTDTYGCTVAASATVGDIPMTTTSNIATSTTCGLNNGAVTTSAIGSYLWNNGETTQTINNLAAGVYTVVVTDSYGCTATADASVAPSQSVNTANTATPTTCGLNNGTATTSAIGSYLWSNGETTQTINDLAAGVYTVVVTDSYGCTATADASVAPSNLLSATINNNNGVLVTTAGYTTQWFLNGTAIMGAVSFYIVPTQYGDYTVQITDAQGCTTVSPVYTFTNVGVESVGNSSFLIFPNPVHDLLTFQSDAIITKVEVYDAMGRLVQASTLNDNNRLSVEKLSNGIYFLNVYSESGVMRGRVVKE